MSSHISGETRGDGRFHLKRRLGAGGVGIVYEAFDTKRNTVVALKTLRAFDPAALQRFKQEFRTLADIDHVHLVSLYELFGEGDDWFFTMELVKGVPLADYVWNDTQGADSDAQNLADNSPTVEPGSAGSGTSDSDSSIRLRDRRGEPSAVTSARIERLRRVMSQVAEGLCAIHDAGILHRDIKPSNVLVTPEGLVVMLDFGLATELGGGESLESQIVGTPAYMSPEQSAGRPVDEASDWYSVGVMLYAGLTGHPPFLGSTRQVLRTKQEFEPPRPKAISADVPDDLDSLCHHLLKLDPDQRPSGAQVIEQLSALPGGGAPRSAAHPVSSRALVGREREVADLLSAYDRSGGEEAVVACLEGRSGMGKSALARRFLRTIRQRDRNAMVLSGRCYEQESVPYKAIDGIIDELTRVLVRLSRREVEALLPRNILALARLFPVLRQITAVAALSDQSAAMDSQEVRRRAFAALRELLRTLAKRHRLVLFVDDLQWGDLDSAALLAELLRPPDPPALFLVMTYRSEERQSSIPLNAVLSALATGAPHLQVLTIPVGELSVMDARGLASELLAGSPDAAAHADAIAQESGGSPFFVEALARYALESGRVASLVDVLGARVAQLSADARLLLELVSLNSQPLDFEIGKSATEWQVDPHAVLHQLRSLHLVRIRAVSECTAVEPYHDRIRETVVEALDAETRRAHHFRLAKACEASGRADPELLATHYEGAGDLDHAAEYAERAAALADEALAFDHAARLYRWALSLRPADATSLRPTYAKLAKALANTGKGREAAEAYLRAADGAAEVDVIEFEGHAGEQFLRVGDVDRGLAVIARLLARVGVRLPRTTLAALPSLLFNRAYLAIRGYGFRERAESAIASNLLRQIDIFRSAALGMHFLDPLRGQSYHYRSLLLALKTGEPRRIGRGLAVHISATTFAGGRRKFAQMEALRRQSAEIADTINDDYLRGMTKMVAGVGLGTLGDHQGSLVQLEAGAEILRDRCVGALWETQSGRVFMMESLYWQGGWAELRQRLPGYIQICDELSDGLTAVYMKARVHPFVLLFSNEPEQARAAARAAIASWTNQASHMPHFYEMYAQLYVDLYCGESEAGFARLKAHRWRTARSMLLKGQKFRVEIQSIRGRLALMAAARGDRQMLRIANREGRRLEAEDIPWAEGLASLLHAGVAIIRGERARAITLLAGAERQLDACQMKAFLAAARWRRGELIGGDEGRELIQSSERWMAAEQIADPVRMTNMLAPGRWR